MKKLISLIIAILIVTSAAVFPASAKKKNGFEYYVDKKGVVIESYYGKEKVVKVPSKIDGKKVYRLGDDGYYGEDSDAAWTWAVFNKYVEKVVIPDSVKYVGNEAFDRCPNLKTVIFGKGVTKIKAGFNFCPKLKKVVLPSRLKIIDAYTFLECESLKSIKIPSSVTEIGEGAFQGSGVKTISFGKNLKKISSDAFSYSKLKKITVSKKNKALCSKDGVLYNKKKTALLIYPNRKTNKKFIVPSTVKTIKKESFAFAKYLEKVVLSKNINKIESCAFWDCKKLKSVLFKTKKKTSISAEAFLDCKSLKSVTIPKNVTKILKQAFGFYTGTKQIIDEGELIETVVDKRVKGFTIKGYKGSAAEKYAKANKLKFKAI